eukprot:3442372-Amphidinium_carterae.1
MLLGQLSPAGISCIGFASGRIGWCVFQLTGQTQAAEPLSTSILALNTVGAPMSSAGMVNNPNRLESGCRNLQRALQFFSSCHSAIVAFDQ